MLSIRDITKKYNVTTVTVNTWLRGSRVREPLISKVSTIGRVNRIEVDPNDLANWLAQYRPDLLDELPAHTPPRAHEASHAGAD